MPGKPPATLVVFPGVSKFSGRRQARLAFRGYVRAPNDEGPTMDHKLLGTFPLFDGMTDAELERSVAAFEPIRRLAGERVTKEDDYGYSFFLVVSGKVVVESGSETVAELGPGDHFGEVALVTGNKRNATVRAIETCELAKTMAWEFSALLESNPVLAERIRVIAGERS